MYIFPKHATGSLFSGKNQKRPTLSETWPDKKIYIFVSRFKSLKNSQNTYIYIYMLTYIYIYISRFKSLKNPQNINIHCYIVEHIEQAKTIRNIYIYVINVYNIYIVIVIHVELIA